MSLEVNQHRVMSNLFDLLANEREPGWVTIWAVTNIKGKLNGSIKRTLLPRTAFMGAEGLKSTCMKEKIGKAISTYASEVKAGRLIVEFTGTFSKYTTSNVYFTSGERFICLTAALRKYVKKSN